MPKREPMPRLFDGRQIMCPRCRTKVDILAMETEREIPAFESQTVPIHRCRCGWRFALKPDPMSSEPIGRT